jgi:hypothetical protein
VLYNKILFLHYLVCLDENTQAKQICCAQKEYNFPGFVSEGKELLMKFDLPNIVDESIVVTKSQWKTMVKFEDLMKEKIQKMTKLKDGPMGLDNFELKTYKSEMNVTDARTLFRVRSQTTDVQMNQCSNKAVARNLWKCSECGNRATFSGAPSMLT